MALPLHLLPSDVQARLIQHPPVYSPMLLKDMEEFLREVLDFTPPSKTARLTLRPSLPTTITELLQGGA